MRDLHVSSSRPCPCTEKDYSSQPVCNLRDVFLLPGITNPNLQGYLFRSGKLRNLPDINKFKTVVNFCCEEDNLEGHSCTPLHFPFPDGLSVYDLQNAGTRQWCIAVLEGIAHSEFPLIFHCFSGKDRTGVIAAILQKIWKVSDDLIMQDYNNSDGELSSEMFSIFLSNLPDFIETGVNSSLINLLTDACSAVPQSIRVRGGYLPRLLNVRVSEFSAKDSSPTCWHYNVDDVGRLNRVRGCIFPHGDDVSKRKNWCYVSAFGQGRDHLCDSKQYIWVPIIPQELGGVNSPLNEILMSKEALRHYRLHFEQCIREQRSINIDITFDYGADATNMLMGLQKPAIILLKLSESVITDDVDIDVIYNL